LETDSLTKDLFDLFHAGSTISSCRRPMLKWDGYLCQKMFVVCRFALALMLMKLSLAIEKAFNNRGRPDLAAIGSVIFECI
jgi:hypothetical protein